MNCVLGFYLFIFFGFVFVMLILFGICNSGCLC